MKFFSRTVWTLFVSICGLIMVVSTLEVGRESKETKKPCMLMVIAGMEDSREALASIKDYQDKFNYRYNYDWVIVGSNIHIDGLRSEILSMVGGNVKFVKMKIKDDSTFLYTKLGEDIRKYPPNFKMKSTSRGKRLMMFTLTYLFQLDEIWDHYNYYWRIPAGSTLGCEVAYDPFEYMNENNIDYGWLLIHKDYQGEQFNLMNLVQPYFKDLNNFHQFLLDENQDNTANWHFKACSIMPEFELVSVQFMRSEKVQNFILYLHQQGVVNHRGWSEPFIKTILAYTLSSNTHFFHDLSVQYENYGLINCPTNPEIYLLQKCTCDPFLADQQFIRPRISKPYEIMASHECVAHYLTTMGQETPEAYIEDPQFRSFF